MLDLLFDPHAWAALVTLTALEIVLGIDNVVFISVLVSRLDPAHVTSARRLGLGLALIFRILLLFALTWLIGLTEPLFILVGRGFSWHDVILIVGGLFLIGKATHEMHAEIESAPESEDGAADPLTHASFFLVIVQLIAIDLVFSIDSIVTAIRDGFCGRGRGVQHPRAAQAPPPPPRVEARRRWDRQTGHAGRRATISENSCNNSAIGRAEGCLKNGSCSREIRLRRGSWLLRCACINSVDRTC